MQLWSVVLSLLAVLPSLVTTAFTVHPAAGNRIRLFSTEIKGDNNLDWITSELVDDPDELEELDWMPDRDKAKMLREQAKALSRAPQPTIRTDDNEVEKTARSVYTDEEEDLIQAMGGKVMSSKKREPGFLGDCTLNEIATDYGVPVCYVADVLCMWGVAVPINTNDRLGDLVTGEQAFSLVEAIHTLDAAALQDRYSNDSFMTICDWYDVDLKEAFQMAMKEGWSMPFGVQTFLRVEQEEELIRVLG